MIFTLSSTFPDVLFVHYVAIRISMFITSRMYNVITIYKPMFLLINLDTLGSFKYETQILLYSDRSNYFPSTFNFAICCMNFGEIDINVNLVKIHY